MAITTKDVGIFSMVFGQVLPHASGKGLGISAKLCLCFAMFSTAKSVLFYVFSKTIATRYQII